MPLVTVPALGTCPTTDKAAYRKCLRGAWKARTGSCCPPWLPMSPFDPSPLDGLTPAQLRMSLLFDDDGSLVVIPRREFHYILEAGRERGWLGGRKGTGTCCNACPCKYLSCCKNCDLCGGGSKTRGESEAW